MSTNAHKKTLQNNYSGEISNKNIKKGPHIYLTYLIALAALCLLNFVLFPFLMDTWEIDAPFNVSTHATDIILICGGAIGYFFGLVPFYAKGLYMAFGLWYLKLPKLLNGMYHGLSWAPTVFLLIKLIQIPFVGISEYFDMASPASYILSKGEINLFYISMSLSAIIFRWTSLRNFGLLKLDYSLYSGYEDGVSLIRRIIKAQ